MLSAISRRQRLSGGSRVGGDAHVWFSGRFDVSVPGLGFGVSALLALAVLTAVFAFWFAPYALAAAPEATDRRSAHRRQRDRSHPAR